MGTQFGLGPVFAYEWLTQSRRWQIYAMRSLFGSVLLAAMAVVWVSGFNLRGSNSLQAYAEIGQAFFLGLAGMQIALVLLAAPAATAGAVCLEKQRGSLAHLLVTDLSDAEIVLGKLAARLVPVLGLLLGSLPIVAMSMLLGGIDPRALLGAFLISIGVAVLGCSLALAFSVWATKTHEALLGTFAVLGLWLMAIPIARGLNLAPGAGWWRAAIWLESTNPFFLAFRPYLVPGSENLTGGAIFCLVALGVSTPLLALATFRLRPVAANPRTPKPRAPRSAPRTRRGWVLALPGPSLDGNPVLWREWHRARPSRWMRIIWSLYAATASLFSLMVIGPWLRGHAPSNMMAAHVNLWVGSIGLLMLSVTASTAMAEERVRGSLDILLATPLSTRSIVWGKWWGAARTALPLTILPGLVALSVASKAGLWFSWILVPVYLLAASAAITGLGLALATWQPRPGRAVALTVSAYLLASAGWLFLILTLQHGPSSFKMGYLSPSFALAEGTFSLGNSGYPGMSWYYVGMPVAIASWSIVAALLLAATMFTFDRCLGRVSDRPDEAKAKPRKAKPKIILE